jgi:hypothetical protein
LQNLAQGDVPIRTTGTSEEDADWIKIYGEMIPVTNEDRMFGPTYNQLIDYYYEFRRPTVAINWSDVTGDPSRHPNAPPTAMSKAPLRVSMACSGLELAVN